MIPERSASTDYELLFRIVLEPLGIKVFNISKSMEKLKKAVMEHKSSFQLKNQNIQVSFNAAGELQQIELLDGENLKTNLKQEFCFYKPFVGISPLPDQQSSGAYVFRPTEQVPTCLKVANYTVKKSPLVQEVHQVFGDWISQTIRLYDNATCLEFEWQIGPIPTEGLEGKEVITLFTSDLISNATFYTDSNGREILKRVRDFRPSWPNFNQTEPVSGNYYPINSRILIRDEYADVTSRQLTIVTDRSYGGASIEDGSIEIMLHRRLLMDDILGLTEPLDELGVTLHGLIAKGKHYLFFNSSQNSAALHRDKAHKVNMQPLITFVNETSEENLKNLNKFKAVQVSLPENVELLTLAHDFSANALVVRFEHFYEQNEDFILSQDASFDIKQLFNSTINILNYEELAIGANMKINELQNRLKWNYENKELKEPDVTQDAINKSSFLITLHPMQIRTFKLWYLPVSV